MLSTSPESDSVQVLPSPEEQTQEPPRKLAVLGLPWETVDDTLRLHFSQFGAVEATEIMKDRLSGKSRGFGFVTFVDPAAAAHALQMEHTIDGRRCEAKVALPKNLLQTDLPPAAAARTTRIFVARIPQSVTDTQFRSYFEKFGRLQDAYMPRDHSRQMYRGIGFVTFASPESVEKVMACKHWLNGHEVAIDRATPKEDGRTAHNHNSTALSVSKMGPGARRSFDNGAGIVGPGLTPAMTYQQQLSQLLADPAAMAASLAGGMRLSEDKQRDFSNAAAELATSHFNAAAAAAAAACADFNAAAAAAAAEQAACGSGSPLLPSTTAGMLAGLNGTDPTCQPDGSKSPTALDGAAAAAAANAAAAAAAMAVMNGMPMQGLPGLLGNIHGLSPGMNHTTLQNLSKAAGLFPPSPLGQFPGLPGLNPLGAPLPGMPDAFGNPLFAGLSGMANPMKAAAVPPVSNPASSRKSLDSLLHAAGGASSAGRRSSENPAIQSVRNGPRIFIGKLTKDTTEADVKEYFGRFGFVMDVYMPKAKDNKAEHRGFGFVTFETDAAIKRVVGAGTHKLKGSTIAIDIAMPKMDEDNFAVDGLGSGAVGGMNGAISHNTGLGAPGLGAMPGRASMGSNPGFDPGLAAGMMAAAAAAQQFNARNSLQIM